MLSRGVAFFRSMSFASIFTWPLQEYLVYQDLIWTAIEPATAKVSVKEADVMKVDNSLSFCESFVDTVVFKATQVPHKPDE